jgi:threonine dehydrogenase-like Zn-dependent dehydrogenase
VSTSVNPSRPWRGLAGRTLPRPRLTVVPRVVSRAPRLPFLALVVVVLGTGLVGLLLLNTTLERGTYQVTALRTQTAQLTLQQQALQLKVAAMQDPQRVAQQAQALGMVQNLSPAFLSLATGQVLGHAQPGAAGNRADIGAAVGPSVDRLSKIAPIVAGAANGAGVTVVGTPPHRHQGPPGRDTKAVDTTATSAGSRH